MKSNLRLIVLSVCLVAGLVGCAESRTEIGSMEDAGVSRGFSPGSGGTDAGVQVAAIDARVEAGAASAPDATNDVRDGAGTDATVKVGDASVGVDAVRGVDAPVSGAEVRIGVDGGGADTGEKWTLLTDFSDGQLTTMGTTGWTAQGRFDIGAINCQSGQGPPPLVRMESVGYQAAPSVGIYHYTDCGIKDYQVHVGTSFCTPDAAVGATFMLKLDDRLSDGAPVTIRVQSRDNANGTVEEKNIIVTKTWSRVMVKIKTGFKCFSGASGHNVELFYRPIPSRAPYIPGWSVAPRDGYGGLLIDDVGFLMQ